ncbi:protein of unknown function DUF947 [Kipferlia bialata]|uniref:rRNA biogenesis protein RRP36 n=1 Tax=Kipferlia bialata TaxID=797122 RepID=A0A9K3CP98_9EUKA|nr:protein of unknown function DUF947 [Kipferlia bialata]|eukprot:g738.t1
MDDDDTPMGDLLAQQGFKPTVQHRELSRTSLLRERIYDTSRHGKSKKSKKKAGPQEVDAARPVRGSAYQYHEEERGLDPRFDSAIGTFRQDKFDQQFAFLQEMRSAEEKGIRKALKKASDEDRGELLGQLSKVGVSISLLSIYIPATCVPSSTCLSLSCVSTSGVIVDI